MIAIIVVVVLALSGGTTFVAESSLPGDVLYGVKTSVNENVRGLFAMGAEADAKWEAELAVRRLEEAAELQKRGELTDEQAEELNAQFSAHAEAAMRAPNLGSSGQDGVSVDIKSRLESAVQLHSEVLAPRDAASGQATGKRTFVLPHVLEVQMPALDSSDSVLAPRDAASGQATGKRQAADLDGDGIEDVATVETQINVDGGNVKGEIAPAGEQTDTGASLQIDSTTEIKPSYDLKANKKI